MREGGGERAEEEKAIIYRGEGGGACERGRGEGGREGGEGREGHKGGKTITFVYHSDVAFQYEAVGSSVRTVWAAERFAARVNSEMAYYAGFINCLVSTHCTLVLRMTRPMYIADVKIEALL